MARKRKVVKIQGENLIMDALRDLADRLSLEVYDDLGRPIRRTIEMEKTKTGKWIPKKRRPRATTARRRSRSE